MASVPPADPASPAPFDRAAVRAHRDRAARHFGDNDFLFQETAARLTDRLDDMRHRFPIALDLGCHGGGLAAALAARPGTDTVVQCDLSPLMARAARATGGIATLAADEEALPFAAQSFNLIASNLSLHWVNDLPGALTQIRTALKPDGLFLGCLLGGTTLSELRAAFMDAELAVEGGASPRVSPFADVRDGGDLLTRAGFALPVADLDTIDVYFPGPLELMAGLRAMGEANAVHERRKSFSRRRTVLEAARLYPGAEAQAAGGTGEISARFDVIWLAGWAPGPDQPRPLAPGSAKGRLADALKTEEHPAGEKPGGRR
jgi:NADH dehydrogenase [ubiquinone] 1 alpha subcomplex assembly factor 5